MRRASLTLLAMFLCALPAVGPGCGGTGSTSASSSSQEPPPPTRGAHPVASASASASVAAPRLAFREEDFVETEQSRDPFRSFAHTFQEEAKVGSAPQRDVLVDRVPLDDLKLVGIVTGGAENRAMLVAPGGVGWIVHRGQFVGRSEVVRGTGPRAAEYELNWRVERIRDGDVVFVREDPAHSDVPPATRIVPLRPDGAEKAGGR